jgi:hypothetical protein
MIVYKATNCLNDKVYICVSGRTLNDAVSIRISRARAKPRKMKLKDAYTGKDPFSKAVLRHGEHNFKFETLHMNVSQKKAYKLKKQYIKEYNAMDPEYGYNCTTGGMESFKNAPHVIERQAEANTGKTMPESYVKWVRARVGELHPSFGIKHSEEIRARMSQAQKDSDYVHTEEHRRRIGASAKKVWADKEFKEKMIQKHKDMGRWGGKKNPMYGKGRKGKDNPMYGKPSWNRGVPMTEENKQKLQEGREKHREKVNRELVEKYKNRTEKKCTKCGEVKPVNEFDKSYNSIDPIIGKCKPCERIRSREKYYRLSSPNKTKNRYGKLIADIINEN